MHVRSRWSRTDRALDQAKDLGALAQAKAADAAATLSDKAQATLVPAAEEAAKRAQAMYRSEVKPALTNAAATTTAAVATATAAAAAAAEAARDEVDKHNKQTRKRAGKRSAGRAERSRVETSGHAPRRHWLRNISVALGLAAVAAWAAGKARRRDEGVVVATTPSSPEPRPSSAPRHASAVAVEVPADVALAGVESTDGSDTIDGERPGRPDETTARP